MNYKEIFNYILFGGITTFINLAIYGILTSQLVGIDYRISTSVAWVVSVIVAFFTNKKYVFHQDKSRRIFSEFTSFILFRLLFFGVDLGLMIILVNGLTVDDFIAKLFANVVIIILNYLVSKFIIFNGKSIKNE